jgi:DNA-binding transcriptional LysR family regulator
VNTKKRLMRALDLNLLTLLVTLGGQRSVNRAAIKLGCSQPPIGAALQ